MNFINPCFPNGIKEFPFTQEDIRDIWLLAKDEFKATGDIGKTVQNLSDKLKFDPYHIAQAITKPKTIPRNVTADAWRAASERMRIVNGAKAMVTARQRAPILNAIDRVWNIPRNLKTLYHWFTFTGTHGGELAFMPSEWGRFFPQFVRGFRSISPAYFDDAIAQHNIEIPNHAIYSAVGLDNNPYSHAMGIFEKGPSNQWYKPGARGYGTLAMARDELMDSMVKQAQRIDPNVLNDKAQMRVMADVVNHVWGSVKLPPGTSSLMSKLFFATKLWPARLVSTIVDIPKAAKTFATWSNAGAGERTAALFTARRLAQVLVLHHGIVAANAVWNKYHGGETVNMTDPSRQNDWMALKIGGLTIKPPSAILEVERVLAGMAYAPFVGKSSTDIAKSYVYNKMQPIIHLGAEAYTGVTGAFERTPFKGLVERITGKPPTEQWGPVKTTYKKQTSPGQYAAEQLLPIPGGGAAREIYEIFKQEGLRSEEASSWMRALSHVSPYATGALESVGVTARRTTPSKQQPSYPFKGIPYLDPNAPR